MLKCSPEAYARCPTRAYCGDPNDATFTEGSECDRFNQAVERGAIPGNEGTQEKVECETCLHRDVCDQSSRQMWSTMAGEKECADYKDRSRFAEVVHGYWEDYMPYIEESPNNTTIKKRCSVCKERASPFMTKYCAECGVKMDGGNEDGKSTSAE